MEISTAAWELWLTMAPGLKGGHGDQQKLGWPQDTSRDVTEVQFSPAVPWEFYCETEREMPPFWPQEEHEMEQAELISNKKKENAFLMSVLLPVLMIEPVSHISSEVKTLLIMEGLRTYYRLFEDRRTYSGWPAGSLGRPQCAQCVVSHVPRWAQFLLQLYVCALCLRPLPTRSMWVSLHSRSSSREDTQFKWLMSLNCFVLLIPLSLLSWDGLPVTLYRVPGYERLTYRRQGLVTDCDGLSVPRIKRVGLCPTAAYVTRGCLKALLHSHTTISMELSSFTIAGLFQSPNAFRHPLVGLLSVLDPSLLLRSTFS